MLVAIISDVHNNQVNLKKVLTYCAAKKIEKIICCGDLASEETLNFLAVNFSGEIYYVLGNMDRDQLQENGLQEKYKNVFLFKDFGETKIDGQKIAFTHFPHLARELAFTKRYVFVFYGHTHQPWEETIGLCKILNPGNAAGERYWPTFAVWNTEDNSFKLIRIHDLK